MEFLNRKLLEEVQEHLESGTVEELEDIGEVMHAIMDIPRGVPESAPEKARAARWIQE